MQGKHVRKTEKRVRIHIRVIAVSVLVLAVCVSSIAAGIADTVSATVIDGAKNYSFHMRSTDLDQLIAEAREMGLPPLGDLDVCEQVGNTTTINIRRGVRLRVDDSGRKSEFVAYQGDSLRKALEENNVLLKEDDVVEPDRDTLIDDRPQSVTIRRRSSVVVETPQQQHRLHQLGGTVQEVLDQLGILPGPQDALNYPLDQPLFDGMRIRLSKTQVLCVTVDGETDVHRVAAATIGEALDKLRIPYRETDRITPPLSAKLSENQSVEIVRVASDQLEELAEIPFQKLIREDDSLPLGERRLLTPGINGTKKLVYQIQYDDGRESRREKLQEIILTEPVDQVTLVGTGAASAPSPTLPKADPAQAPSLPQKAAAKPPKPGNASPAPTQKPVPGDHQVLDVSGNLVNYSQMLTGLGTAYCDVGLTASGHQAGPDYVAVNPAVIPYGTRLYIRSQDGAYERYCTASDTGGNLLNGNVMIDLWFPTAEECYDFGVRDLDVYFLS